jgi:hypothetical protein
MAHLLFVQQVEDYERWKKGFDEGEPVRDQAGVKGGHVFRDADNPETIVVMLHMSDDEKARQYMESPQLREKMKETGVIGIPKSYFLEETERLKKG